MPNKFDLQDIINDPLSSPAQVEQAKALLAEETAPTKETPAVPQRPSHVTEMLAQLAAEPLPSRTLLEKWDEAFRIVALQEVNEIMPNATGNDKSNAADLLRANADWRSAFEEQYGTREALMPTPEASVI
jgi:hypothetical protein